VLRSFEMANHEGSSAKYIDLGSICISASDFGLGFAFCFEHHAVDTTLQINQAYRATLTVGAKSFAVGGGYYDTCDGSDDEASWTSVASLCHSSPADTPL